MIYVMTGLKGDFEKYLALKDKILLKKSDDLFLLGGVLGKEGGIKILLDAMSAENIFPIAGKDELSALKHLDYLNNKDKINEAEAKKALAEWFRAGGYPTADEFLKLDDETKESILDYLREDFTLFEELEAGGEEFILAYAGLGDFDPDRELDDYTPEDLTNGDYTPNCYFDEKYIICGNLFDFEPEEDGFEDKIYKSENVVVLNHIANTKPCCIRLNDLREYYAD